VRDLALKSVLVPFSICRLETARAIAAFLSLVFGVIRSISKIRSRLAKILRGNLQKFHVQTSGFSLHILHEKNVFSGSLWPISGSE